MYTDGNLDGYGCTGTYGSRPAFLISSALMIEVEDEEPANPLEEYSTKALLEELVRREGTE